MQKNNIGKKPCFTDYIPTSFIITNQKHQKDYEKKITLTNRLAYSL